MRLPIVGFACGAALLQVQSALPSAPLIGVLAGLALGGIFLTRQSTKTLYTLLSFVCCGVLGFVWAAGMAQQRLADQLPESWQGRDIEITGIIAALPQRFERGERFAFDVETTHAELSAGDVAPVVPRRIALSWYHAWDDGDAGD